MKNKLPAKINPVAKALRNKSLSPQKIASKKLYSRRKDVAKPDSGL